MREKLTRYLKREGLVEPLVLRPHPKEKECYELIGVDMKDPEAKKALAEYDNILNIILNYQDKIPHWGTEAPTSSDTTLQSDTKPPKKLP